MISNTESGLCVSVCVLVCLRTCLHACERSIVRDGVSTNSTPVIITHTWTYPNRIIENLNELKLIGWPVFAPAEPGGWG